MFINQTHKNAILLFPAEKETEIIPDSCSYG